MYNNASRVFLQPIDKIKAHYYTVNTAGKKTVKKS